jgi:hypothetical protein
MAHSGTSTLTSLIRYSGYITLIGSFGENNSTSLFMSELHDQHPPPPHEGVEYLFKTKVRLMSTTQKK